MNHQPHPVVAAPPKDQRKFWSAVATRYDEVVDLQLGPATRSMIRDLVSRESRLGRLVEFGCGTGYYTRELAPKADEMLATDLAPGMLAVAKSRVNFPHVTFQEENCQQTSFADESFDTIFLSLVLHFTDPRKAIREMHRILRPGGTLIVSNLDENALTGLNRFRCRARVIFHGLTKYRLKPARNLSPGAVSQKDLKHILEQTGFDISSVQTVVDSSKPSHIPLNYFRTTKIETAVIPTPKSRTPAATAARD